MNGIEIETDFSDHDFLVNEDTQKDKYLSFKIDQEEYTIQINRVTEIVVMQKVTYVPDMPGYFKGVINLRGKVISVMDFRARFNLSCIEYDDRTCIIVINVDDQKLGLIVDTVKEVVTIPDASIDPPPHMGSLSDQVCIDGLGKIGNSVKIMLNIDKILAISPN